MSVIDGLKQVRTQTNAAVKEACQHELDIIKLKAEQEKRMGDLGVWLKDQPALVIDAIYSLAKSHGYTGPCP